MAEARAEAQITTVTGVRVVRIRRGSVVLELHGGQRRELREGDTLRVEHTADFKTEAR